MTKQYVIGDIHGFADRMAEVLQAAGLVSDDLAWAGGQAVLWTVGDYFDRGPDGIGVVELLMRWQAEAEASGGEIVALLGNHDIQLLAAHRFRHRASTGPGKTFLADWQRNGGMSNDLARLAVRHIDWLTSLPLMVQRGDRLFIHADASVYTHYGNTVETVNSAFARLLTSDDTDAWDKVLSQFSEHHYFQAHNTSISRALACLDQYGGRQIIHGHTPIMSMNHTTPGQVTEPLVYADGLCVNVDGGMYRGGPGFVYELPPVWELAPVV